MTVGMPGAAIGGLFYVVSAACAPPVALVRWCVNRNPQTAAELRTALRQGAIAWGIVAATLSTGWALAAGVQHAQAPADAAATAAVEGGRGTREALQLLAVLSSCGTLAFVLLAVQVLRLFVPARQKPHAAPESTPSAARRPSRGRRVFLLALACLGATPPTADARSPREWVAAGDSALAAGNAAAACASYDAALHADAQCSRALFQRARVAANDPEACTWLRRYTALEPGDAWGWMALGDHAARSGRPREANSAYERAVALVPRERDACLGLARVQAATGRTDAAIATYTAWLRRQPADVEAATELGRAQRRAGRLHEAARTLAAVAPHSPRAGAALLAVQAEAAPAVEPFLQSTADSDHNHRFRAGVQGDVALPRGSRAGVRVSRLRVTDPNTARNLDAVTVQLGWRPTAAVRLEAAPGVAHAAAVTPGDVLVPAGIPAQNELAGSARLRWQSASTGLMFDAGVRRELLDATAALLDARILRSEGSVRMEVPLAWRFAARGSGQRARYAGATPNGRTQWMGTLVLRPRRLHEWSVSAAESRFDHGTADGYYAPARVQSLEMGSYGEFELGTRVMWALDVGAGAERIREFGAPAGAWDAAFRGWTQLSIVLRPGCALRIEGEANDSRASADAQGSGGWRYGFAAASVRWALH